MSFIPNFNRRAGNMNLGMTRGRNPKDVWTLVERWKGSRGVAEVETNGKGQYRVTCGEIVKHLGSGATDFSHKTRDAAHALAKILSGFQHALDEAKVILQSVHQIQIK